MFVAALLYLVVLLARALAAAPSGQVIYVGDEAVTGDGYWTTDDSGNVTAFTGTGAPTDHYIHYDTANNTLTLHNAAIKESVSSDTSTYVEGAAIGVFHQKGAVELTIRLEGSNAIENVGTGINVLAFSDSTGDASLTITGSGSLDTSGRNNPAIRVQSNGGNATLSIENAKVTATASSSGYGVLVQSKNDSSVSLTVDGGSLTATGSGNDGAGIQLLFGSGDSGSGTPTVTVSNNAIMRASGNADGIATNSTAATPSGTGIVFDGGTGTVYGSVTLQEDLEIGEGESLTIGQDARLTTDGKLTVNGGTLIGTPNGDVTYKVTGVSLNKDSLTLDEDSSETLNATVAPNNATNQEVTWTSNEEKVATVDANGKVTAVGEGNTTITVTTKDGSKTDTCTVVVTHGNLVHTPKQEPTCNDVGTQEYWTCDICGKHYSDSSATDEVSLADLTIPQLSCPTQSTSSSTTQPTATYDDGGPFTTDQYGNVYDRWGNEIWHNPSPQSASNTTIGYQLVATIDK